MGQKHWHMHRTEATLTLSRGGAERWDVSAEGVLPLARKGRLAHQIRQDLWRMLRHLRGFCPMVRVMEDGPHLIVTAGGQVDVRPFPKAMVETRIADLLASPAHRARWLRYARLGGANA